MSGTATNSAQSSATHTGTTTTGKNSFSTTGTGGKTSFTGSDGRTSFTGTGGKNSFTGTGQSAPVSGQSVSLTPTQTNRHTDIEITLRQNIHMAPKIHQDIFIQSPPPPRAAPVFTPEKCVSPRGSPAGILEPPSSTNTTGVIMPVSPLKSRIGDFNTASTCSSDSTVDIWCGRLCDGEGYPCSQDPRCHTLKENPCKDSVQKMEETFISPCGFISPSCTMPDKDACCNNKVLVFHAFYQEAIPESPTENYRIHQCHIRYFPQDGTIQVHEPKTFDPGFPQGRIINRHKIPFPPPNDNFFYTLDHLNIGCEVTFYGKTFLICGVDDCTRKWLNRSGRAVPANLEMPFDPYTEWRKDRIISLFARPARINLDRGKAEKFMNYGHKLLRFWALWDSRCVEPAGDLRRFILHYYLQDDTIEIQEYDPKKRYRVPTMFLNRGKLLKNYKDLVTAVGAKEEALLVLNIGGVQDFGMHNQLLDRLCPGIEEKDFYKAEDLAIGAVINVYGRAFVLTECDKFTQQYYREKYGVEDFTPLVLNEKTKKLARMETPPSTGYGQEEDTLANWDKINPTPPKDSPTFLAFTDNDTLKFCARFYNTLQKVNCDRRFNIVYYLADQTVQIYEKPHPNTGFQSGIFLYRTKVKKGPSDNDITGEPNEYLGVDDFFIGSILTINGFQFVLTGADEQTLAYMEDQEHRYMFPKSNLCLILEKLKEVFGYLEATDVVQVFCENDTCGQGVMSADDFTRLIKMYSKCSLSEHEIITLKRGFRVTAPAPGPDMLTLQAVMQTELQRYHFGKYELQRLEYDLRDLDPCRTGMVDRNALFTIMKGNRVPIDKAIIQFFVNNFPAANDCNQVNYCEVVKYLNWIDNCVPNVNPASVSCILKWLEPQVPNEIYCINYRAFLDKICPTVKCSLGELFTNPCERYEEPDHCAALDAACPDYPKADFSLFCPNFPNETEEYKACQPHYYGPQLGNNNGCKNPTAALYRTKPCCEIEAGKIDYNPGNCIGYEDLYGKR